MQWTRKQGIAVVIVGVLAVALGYGAWLLVQRVADPYRGLTTRMEVEMDDATRVTIENRLKVSLASLESLQDTDQEIDTDLYMVIAEDAMFLGDLAMSRSYYEQALKQNPINPVIWNNLGYVSEMMSDIDYAEDAYQRAVENGSDTEEYYRDLVTFLEVHHPDQQAEIKSLLESQIDVMGQTVWNMVRLAQWYEKHNDCERAVAHYKVAMTLDPENASIEKDYDRVRAECK